MQFRYQVSYWAAAGAPWTGHHTFRSKELLLEFMQKARDAGVSDAHIRNTRGL